MPLRYVRKRLTAENALSVAVATASVTRELSDLLQCPPARAATGILLLIFETIQVRLMHISTVNPTHLRDAGNPNQQNRMLSLGEEMPNSVDGYS